MTRGLAGAGPNRLLPIEISKAVGALLLGAEVGYWSMHDQADRWVYGVVVGYPFSEILELLCELHTVTDHSFHHDNTVFNLGLRKQLSTPFCKYTHV